VSVHFARLGLSEDANPADIKARYRQLAFERHPDVGGDPIEFAALHESYQLAMAQALTRPCKACDGLGVITTMVGLSPVTRRCKECNP